MADTQELLLGVDLGATGIKVGAFTPAGGLVARSGCPNAPRPQRPDEGGRPGDVIWDVDALWDQVAACCRDVVAQVGDARRIRGVATAGFGTDGVPMDAHSHRLYPMISWHDGARTAPQAAQLGEQFGDARLYRTTGYHNYAINTLARWLWLRQNSPRALDDMAAWLHVQDWVAFKLSGEYATEVTIASTTMALDLARRAWAPDLLAAAGIRPDQLAPLRESGTPIGGVTPDAAEATGLAAGTPVVTGGHDCEVAVLGSGVADPHTLIDITGTWEIVIALTDTFAPDEAGRARGVDWECHAAPGRFIRQSLMIAGGVTEWVRRMLYADVPGERAYETMIAEAESVAPGANGVTLAPAFVRGMGPEGAVRPAGSLTGLTTTTARPDIARALYEGLCFQQRLGLEAVGGTPRRLRVLGGGQKNPLWLQLKADVTGLPLEVSDNPDVTLWGAALLAGVGAGVFANTDEALSHQRPVLQTVMPDPANHAWYTPLYERYRGESPG